MNKTYLGITYLFIKFLIGINIIVYIHEVQDIAKERKYDFVFDRSSDIIMLYSAKNYDISDLVLRRIQVQERIKERQEKINSAKKVLDDVSN